MSDALLQISFIGPGGPEFLMAMLVLLMLFGAKDAPRILRKFNEIISQIRNAANDFKREVMYGDLDNDAPSYDESTDGVSDYEDYDYDAEENYYDGNEDEEESADEVFKEAEEELEKVAVPEIPSDEEDDAPKA